jgi:hypothetical protein
MKMSLDKRFKSNLKGRFGKYSFEVGVLQDKPHKIPKRGERGLKGTDVMGTYAGGPVRQATRKAGALTVAEVSKANRKRLGFNYLAEPFKGRKQNADIIRFSQAFMKMAFGKSEPKRTENLLQAIVRNPIKRGDYGGNSKLTQKIKGFNRGMIDTAQLFKAIKAVCKVRGR